MAKSNPGVPGGGPLHSPQGALLDGPAAETPVLSVEDLRVSFRTDSGLLRAVDGLDFKLYPGEVLGIVGESGSGKSVSMLAITDLIKRENRDTAGRALFLGRDLLGLGKDAMAGVRGREIGFVFQNPMSSLNPTMRIGPQITEAMKRHGVARGSEAREKTIALLDKVGIREPAKRYQSYPHELSGGMRQRVMIAMALSCSPKLLIADEPTTALDVTVEKQILELMMRMKDDLGLSIVMITHNLPVALNYCSRILVMYAGKVMETGTAYQLVSHPSHPYTRALFQSNLELGRRGKRIEPIQGNIPPLTQLPSGCRFHPRCPLATELCKTEAPPRVAVGHDDAPGADAPGTGGSKAEGPGTTAHLALCHYPQ